MKLLIIEVEEPAAERLKKLVNSILPDAEILDTIVSVQSAVRWLQSNPAPDLILLDIHLADGSSFEIFSQVNITTPVIFTTAYDEYAVRAFKGCLRTESRRRTMRIDASWRCAWPRF